MPTRTASALEPRSPAIRPDPLATAYARKRIDHAQYLAGREFQRLYHLADKRRPEQPDGLDADQVKAWQALTRSYQTLGADGSAIVRDVLIRGMSASEVAKARGKVGPQSERFYRMRLQECLRTLTDVFATSRAQAIIASATMSATIATKRPL